jgi:hypothetical protein
MQPDDTETYTQPVVCDYGTIISGTAGQQTGTTLDATFTEGTPANQLRFS